MQAKPVQLIGPQELTASNATYYTSPANKQTILSKLTLTNVSSVAQTVDVHIVPSGGSADATNRLISTKTLDTNEAWAAFPVEGQILQPGDSIQASAGAVDSILIMASGVEIY